MDGCGGGLAVVHRFRSGPGRGVQRVRSVLRMHPESDKFTGRIVLRRDDGHMARPTDHDSGAVVAEEEDAHAHGAHVDDDRDLGPYEIAGVVLHLCGMTLFLAVGSAMAGGGVSSVPAWVVIVAVLMIGTASAGLPVVRRANRFMRERPRWSGVIATALVSAALGFGYGAQELFGLPAVSFAAGWSAGTGLVALGVGTALVQVERPLAEAFRPWIGAVVAMVAGFLRL